MLIFHTTRTCLFRRYNNVITAKHIYTKCGHLRNFQISLSFTSVILLSSNSSHTLATTQLVPTRWSLEISRYTALRSSSPRALHFPRCINNTFAQCETASLPLRIIRIKGSFVSTILSSVQAEHALIGIYVPSGMRVFNNTR